MAILQAGVPKSGNYWLYSIIKNILQQSDLEHRSYIQQHSIQEPAKSWKLSFAGQAQMDFLNIEESCYCRVSEVFKEKITDIDEYIARCSQVWTHSPINPLAKAVLPKFNKTVYIIRDPRDVAISYAKFAFTEHKLTNGSPHYEQSPQTYLANRLESMTRRWVQHVGGYFKYQAELNIYPIFYERLLHSFDSELAKLLAYLEIELAPEAIAEIKHQVTFETMKQKSPKHLRKGSSDQWQATLSDRQKQQVLDIAAPMLELLEYPLSEGSQLPRLPQKIDRAKLDRAIELATPSLFERVQNVYKFVGSSRSTSAKANLMRDWLLNRIERLVRA